MGLAFDFTLFYMGFTLLAAIVPTASYIACLVIGAKRKLQRPCVLPTIIMVVMSLLILLGYSSPVFRFQFIEGVMDDGDEARLNWSFLVEAVATAGLLTLFFLRKALKQEGHHEWIVSWMPETPTLLTVGIASYLLIVANLCPQEGIGWPWVAYAPRDPWSFPGLDFFPWDKFHIGGDILLSFAILFGVAGLSVWWQRWLRRTGAKWYQFHLGTLCVAAFVFSILLGAHVMEEGWLRECMRLEWRVGNLAPQFLIAFLLLLVCWVGCEWLYRSKHLPTDKTQ